MFCDWVILKRWRPLVNVDASGCCLLDEQAAVDAIPVCKSVTCLVIKQRCNSFIAIFNSIRADAVYEL